MHRLLAALILTGGLFFSPLAAAQSPASEDDPMFHLLDEPQRPRSIFWAPFFSFVLPGVDQWWEGQTTSASAYSGTALVANGLGRMYGNEISREQRSAAYLSLSDEDRAERDMYGEQQRRYSLAGQIQMAAGSFSAYHSFRSAVRTQQPHGRFNFLTRAETPKEIFLAPFKFEYLKRPTTLAPLGIVAAMGLLTTAASNDDKEQTGIRKRDLNRSDYFYAGAVSAAAGTHEELLFRGWLMPVLRDATGNDLWSNFLSSTVFAAAHLNTVSLPVFQFAFGAHLAYVTQKNNWTLSESVFIHTWWDVFALLAAYQVRGTEAALPVLWLPSLDIVF